MNRDFHRCRAHGVPPFWMYIAAMFDAKSRGQRYPIIHEREYGDDRERVEPSSPYCVLTTPNGGGHNVRG